MPYLKPNPAFQPCQSPGGFTRSLPGFIQPGGRPAPAIDQLSNREVSYVENGEKAMDVNGFGPDNDQSESIEGYYGEPWQHLVGRSAGKPI